MTTLLEGFTTSAIEAIIESDLLGGIDLYQLTDEEIRNTGRLSREQADDIAKKFRAGLFTPSAHRELAQALALFIASETEALVEVDKDGVPEAPRSPARRSWLGRRLKKDDFDEG